MLRSLLALCLLLLASCAGARREGVWNGDVRVQGGIHAMIQEGKTGSVVNLGSLVPDPTLYAVGALADMVGEVTVVGGKVYLSYGEEGSARVETPEATDAAAALLVAANVPAWHLVTLERAIPFAALDVEIERLAAAAGLDTRARFPFVIEGRLRELEWHVLAGKAPTASASHEDHLKGTTQLRLRQASGTLVGFYSSKDEGVITHPGSRTHLHCVVSEPQGMGHVDHVIVQPGAVIKFPMVTGAGKAAEKAEESIVK